MKTDKIYDGETLLAVLLREQDWEEGLNFLTSDDDYLQAGTWWYPAGKQLAAHIHLEAPREVKYTQEIVFVKRGRMRANIYDRNKGFLQAVDLNTGDTLILLEGGHGYEILEDDTQILEVKCGPFLGVEKDKQVF